MKCLVVENCLCRLALVSNSGGLQGRHLYKYRPITGLNSRLSNIIMAAQSGEWSFRMFGCFENVGLCVITYFVPCVTFGQTSEKLGKSCLVYALFYLIPLLNCYTATKQRGQIRGMRGISGTTMNDCLLTFFCGCCTNIQEHREVTKIQEESGGVKMSAIDRE